MVSNKLERYHRMLTQIVENSPSRNRTQLEDEPTVSSDVTDVAAANHSCYIANVQEQIVLSVQDAARRALARLEEGVYGHCAECDEPINPKRLEAVPWTDCCFACQAARESNLKKAA